MPNYSSGPFMGMSPSGIPGLLIVIAVVFAVASLFVPWAYRWVLFVPFLVAVVLVVVVGLLSQFRSARPESAPHLYPSQVSSADAASSPDPTELRSERWQRFATPVLAVVAAVSLTFLVLLILFLDLSEVVQLWFLAAVSFLAVTGLLVWVVVSVGRHAKPRPPSAA